MNAPNVLAECLDWLCVHVPVDELPLQFRPVAAAGAAEAWRARAAARRRAVAWCSSNSAASLGAPLDDDDDWDDGSTKP